MHHRGCCAADLLAGLAAGGTLLAVTTLALAGGHGARTVSLLDRNAAGLGELHGAMAMFAESFDRQLPRPGLIDRLPTEINGEPMNIPGRGAEDVEANTTANLYASLIIQNYFTAAQVVSPLERNPVVRVDDDYRYEAYDPSQDDYWDHGFTADLREGSNASYAHLALRGERVENHWRHPARGAYPILGNRGPAHGEPDARSFTCDQTGRWSGHVVGADGVVTLRTAVTIDGLTTTVDGQRRLDNIFAMETGADGADSILAFTTSMKKDGPTLQWD